MPEGSPVLKELSIYRRGSSRQSHALYRDPMHQTAIAVIIVDCLVPGGAVVPNGDIARTPADAASALPRRSEIAASLPWIWAPKTWCKEWIAGRIDPMAGASS